MKPIRYGPFIILEKIGDNVFCLNLPLYMQIYSVVNNENLKLHEPLLIMDTKEVGQVPTVDNFAPEYLDKLSKDIIFNRKTRTSRRGDVEYVRISFKGMHPSKARWIKNENVREKFLHFPID